jgi:uncharacterized protein Yka (UPF0111/DUF47 family)
MSIVKDSDHQENYVKNKMNQLKVEKQLVTALHFIRSDRQKRAMKLSERANQISRMESSIDGISKEKCYHWLWGIERRGCKEWGAGAQRPS